MLFPDLGFMPGSIDIQVTACGDRLSITSALYNHQLRMKSQCQGSIRYGARDRGVLLQMSSKSARRDYSHRTSSVFREVPSLLPASISHVPHKVRYTRYVLPLMPIPRGPAVRVVASKQLFWSFPVIAVPTSWLKSKVLLRFEQQQPKTEFACRHIVTLNFTAPSV